MRVEPKPKGASKKLNETFFVAGCHCHQNPSASEEVECRGREMISATFAILVAVLHAYFALLEMVLWQKPRGLRTFGNTPEKAQVMAVMAFNQGLYNLFLSAGLIVSVVLPMPTAIIFRYFFFGCVIAAGAVGGLTVNRRIFFVQGVPAMIGFVLTLLAL